MAAAKGNKYAAKAKVWTRAIESALANRSRAEQRDGLEAIAHELINKALVGDRDAWREIGDRLEGKPHQTSEGTVNRVTSLEDLPTHERERIAFGSRQGTTEETGGPEEHSAVH